MLTMLIGGLKDGQMMEVQDRMPCVISPVPTEPTFVRNDAEFIRMQYETYEHRTIAFHDILARRPEFNWRQEVFVHPDVDFDSFTESQFVSIVMRLWREYWRRKVSAETPEYAKRAWREKGVTTDDQRV